MSSTSQNDDQREVTGSPGIDYERKYSWVVRVIREFGLPVAILGVLTWWLAVRVEHRFEELENSIKLHQRFLQQICVNTAKEQDKYQCWGIY